MGSLNIILLQSMYIYTESITDCPKVVASLWPSVCLACGHSTVLSV